MASIQYRTQVEGDGTLSIPRKTLEELGILPGDEISIRLSRAAKKQNGKPSKIMTFGMFPSPYALTEEDFRSAEFHGDPEDGLQWDE